MAKRKPTDRKRDNLVKKHDHLYRRLADELREGMRSGRYKPGERLPSVDDLAAHHNLNRITVIRSLKELREAGLITSVAGRGTYVADTPPPLTPPRRRGRILTVGLVSHVLAADGIGPYHALLISAIQDELGKAAGVLMVTPAAHLEPQQRIFELLATMQLDAVIYLGPFDPAVLRKLVAEGPPSVLADFALRHAAEDTILIDNRGGAYQAIAHLVQLGHRDLAVVQGPDDQMAVQDRRTGVQEALQASGIAIPEHRWLAGAFTRVSGEQAARELLRRGPLPTALFCMNDEMAIGAQQVLRREGRLNVPGDLSIIGFDDIPSTQVTSPMLSTIHVETALMGRTTVQRLILKLKDPAHTPTTTIIPTRLVVRESTAPFAPRA